ncbi:MAG TPA: SgcJ/EcaC family oxidoreductase [Thermoanaerobaculia bacterium]|nr:SgcJ/EcaC family oxidoreductase [Thermoanaerobaculia bacterium]
MRVLQASALALLLPAVAAVAQPPAAAPAAAPPPAPDAAAIEAVIRTIPDAWNKRDAQLFASAFADSHDSIVVGGLLFPNMTREINAQAHQRLWQGPYAEGSTVTFEIVEIEQPLPDVAFAIVKGHNAFVQGGESKSYDTVLTLALLRTPEGWRIRQFNNNLVGPRPDARPAAPPKPSR